MPQRQGFTRRDFIRATSAASLLGAGGKLGADENSQRITGSAMTESSQPPDGCSFGIPTCAWRHDLGELPKISLDATSELYGGVAGLNTLMRAKKGIPLGGIGAGNFMYNVCGSFGPWHLKTGRYEERFLSQGAFHFREKVEGNRAITRTLATQDVLPAWERLRPGDGEYYALFPKGWCKYKNFGMEITLEFFSPIIKDNYRETCLPVAHFRFRIKNPTNLRSEVSVMFTFPNAPYTDLQNTPLSLKDEALTLRPRKGLSNRFVQDPHNSARAIVMSAHDESNGPEVQDSEWCIATDSRGSYMTSWDGAGDGSDIWREFTSAGTLSNTNEASSSAIPSGAMCVRAELKPGEETEIPFVLAWYFPQIEFDAGTRWWRRFTEYYPARPGQSLTIASDAIHHGDEWRQQVDAWQKPILQNAAMPDWLKQGALNELYYSTFGGSFWENGCITKQKKFGNRPGQHLASVMECQEYRFAESFDVRHHPSRSTRDLWPRIERDILLAFCDFILDTPDGSCPHDAGSLDPFFDYDGYGRWYNKLPNGIKGRITTPWSELSPKFIQQAHAYWHRTGDATFLQEAWPAMLRTYRYQTTTDVNDDGLSEMKSSEYKDNKLFNAVLWIGALEALQQIAQYRHDAEFLAEVTVELHKARASSETQFWNQQLGYYQFNEKNNDVMGDAMIGQRYVDVTHLEPVLDPVRLTSHYRQLFRRAVLPLKDLNGDGIGDLGVANALHPDSSPGVGDSEFSHQFEVWTGVAYCAAANLYHWGRRIRDGALQANALLAAWGVYSMTWVNNDTAYWFSTPEAWRLEDPRAFRALMYQRARGIWELAMEVGDICFDQESLRKRK
jgi:non-lysosomal glucosylceramidase